MIKAVAAEKKGIRWETIVPVAIFHALAIVALFNFSWQNLVALLILNWFAGSLGIGLGYHRLLTHRGFQVPKWLEYFLATCGTLSLQSSPLLWVTTHRIHHAHTETELDPHSPRSGTYWAHIGWIFKGTAQSQSEEAIQRYAPDLAKDPYHRWLYTWYVIPTVLTGVLLLAIGGWSMVLWGVFLRITIGWHTTWMVNSVTHIWGARRFKTRDDSTNNPLIALLTFGEGWHNNHHAHPRSAKHGLAWYEVDMNWWSINALRKLGLARNVSIFDWEQERARQADEMELQKAA